MQWSTQSAIARSHDLIYVSVHYSDASDLPSEAGLTRRLGPLGNRSLSVLSENALVLSTTNYRIPVVVAW